MSYTWDVFISYKRDYQDEAGESAPELRRQWLMETFLPVFRLALEGEIGRKPNIFWDIRLKTGDLFEDKLLEALSKSKCLVAILSKPYLNDSEWCLREFCFMKKRYETSRETYPNTFIYPIVYQKIDTIHPLLRGMQVSDFTRYNKIGPAFRESREYLALQDDISGTAPTIAKVIDNPPAWKQEWTSKEWLVSIDEMVEELRTGGLSTKIESKNVQM